jgi:hypothetical protein
MMMQLASRKHSQPTMSTECNLLLMAIIVIHYQ